MNLKVWQKFIPALLLIVLLLPGCGPQGAGGGAGPQVWIDVPLNGINFEPGQAVNIEGHASAAGDAGVEIWVNAELVTTLDTSPVRDELSYFTTSYTPPGIGNYAIQAVLADTGSETTAQDTAKISVGLAVAEAVEPTLTALISATPENTPTPEITITPGITISPTPLREVTVTTAVPQMVVEFRADPQEIESGECSYLIWHVENAQRVVFGGVEQSMDGSVRFCLDKPATYPLTVTSLSGVEEIYRVTVNVITPPTTVPTTPVPGDTTPPPVPAPYKPGDGITIGCVTSTTVMWNEVSDKSGIDEYHVQVQRHSGDNNWKDVSGSPFTASGSSNSASIPLECKQYFYNRWRVRAVDGAGNESGWSVWFHITIKH